MQLAKQRKVTVSFDVNYRQKLWSETEARQTLLPLMKQADLLFCSQADATRLFDCKGSMQEIAQGLLDLTRVPKVIMTFGQQGILCWDGYAWQHEPALPTQVIDRLGAGDALAAGILYGLLHSDFQAGWRYGTVLAAMALSQRGDMVITTEAEMLALSRQSSSLTR
jgi:2-dehydro-3-deoxygluconokinase